MHACNSRAPSQCLFAQYSAVQGLHGAVFAESVSPYAHSQLLNHDLIIQCLVAASVVMVLAETNHDSLNHDSGMVLAIAN